MNGEYTILIMKEAQKDKEKIKQYPAMVRKVTELLEVLKANPFQNPPPYEKLSGNLRLFYSRRINAQHRLVYQVDEDAKLVRIVAMWTHYE